MAEIGDTITVSYEESRKLRKEGWQTRNDVVVMTYVGKPEKVLSNRQRANRFAWSVEEHAE